MRCFYWQPRPWLIRKFFWRSEDTVSATCVIISATWHVFPSLPIFDFYRKIRYFVKNHLLIVENESQLRRVWRSWRHFASGRKRIFLSVSTCLCLWQKSQLMSVGSVLVWLIRRRHCVSRSHYPRHFLTLKGCVWLSGFSIKRALVNLWAVV